MIGCMCSSVSIAVSQLSAPLEIPMVSPSSTSPDLSDKDAHPYFARVVPSDSRQGAGLAELARYLGNLAPHTWTSISLIYSRSTYCESIAEIVGGSSALANMTLIKDPLVNIEDTETTTDDDYAQMVAVANRVAAYSPPPRIFIFPTNSDTIVMLRVFYEAGLFNNESLILGSEGFATDVAGWIDWIADRRQAYLDGDEDVDDDQASFYASSAGDFNWTKLKDILPGNLALTPSSEGPLGTSAKFRKYWTNLTLEKLMEAGLPSAYEDGSSYFSSWFEDPAWVYDDYWTPFMFDATAAVIVAIGRLVEGGSTVQDTAGEALRDALFNSSFEGLTGNVTTDENGDRPGTYSIVNHRKGGVIETVGEYDGVKESIKLTEDPIFPSGSTEVPRDKALPCPAGYELDSTGRICEACLPGSFAPAQGSSCVACPEGSYAAEKGSSACTVALQGTHVKQSGAVEAMPCPTGSFSSVTGAANCTSCSEGFFAGEEGQTECDWCALGSYTTGAASTACTSCPEGETTDDVGAKSAAACICSAGSYRPLADSDSCRACPSGMTCAQGSDMANLGLDEGVFPMALPGYMILASDPLSVYECLSEDNCPGGRPGTCDTLRMGTSIACGECEDGAFSDGDRCRSCDGSTGSLVFLGLLLLIILATLGLLYIVSGTGMKQTHSIINCAVCAGIFCTGLQSMGVYDNLSITWTYPVKSLVSLAKVFSFDLTSLRSACLVGSEPGLHFVTRLAVFPAVLVLVGLTSRGPSTPVYLAQVVNRMGAVFNICFISVVLSCSMPLNCYPHPENGLQSMRHEPSILCYAGGTHTTMLCLGILCFLVMPVPFVALCGFGTLCYPRLVRQASPLTMQAVRFMFAKFPPTRYFYFPIPLLRNLLVSLVPVVLTQVEGQVVSLCTILCFFMFVQVALWPWRGKLPNIIDAVVSMLLQLTLVLGALVIQTSEGGYVTDVANVFVVVAFGILLCFVLALPLRLRFCKRPKKYGHFICHHKAGAAAQARLLKMILKEQGATSVFIDSDDLKDLDTLFDTVKSDVQQLLVYLTRDTLRRPWCAGEVTTAFHASNASVLRIQTPGFVSPTIAEMEDLPNYVDESGCKLTQYNIEWASVKEAFERLTSAQTPCLILQSAPRERQDFDILARAILRGQSQELLTNSSQHRRATRGLQAGIPQEIRHIVISGESDNPETAAAECILQLKMKEVFVARGDELVEIVSLSGLELLQEDDLDLDEGEIICSFVATALGAIVLLSARSLDRVIQLEVICQSVLSREREPKFFIIPVSLPGFSIPSPEYFANTLPRLLPDEHEGVEVHVQSFFKLIACTLTTHASDRALELEVSQILERCITSRATTTTLAAASSRLASGNTLPEKTANVPTEPIIAKVRSC